MQQISAQKQCLSQSQSQRARGFSFSRSYTFSSSAPSIYILHSCAGGVPFALPPFSVSFISTSPPLVPLCPFFIASPSSFSSRFPRPALFDLERAGDFVAERLWMELDRDRDRFSFFFSRGSFSRCFSRAGDLSLALDFGDLLRECDLRGDLDLALDPLRLRLLRRPCDLDLERDDE